jgi:S-(hydroxymethyl)glutathione dehydrogenase/alcohol dehydrogenase
VDEHDDAAARADGEVSTGPAIEAAVGDRLATEGLLVREPGTAPAVEPLRLRPLTAQDVVVDIAVAGLCHSDVSLASGMLRQPMPAVLGHEAAGTVRWCGADVTDVAVGDTVVLDWQPSCGTCPRCLDGEPWICETGNVLASTVYATTTDDLDVYAALGTGAFSRRVVLPATSVHRVPTDIPDDVAAILGCAVITGAGAVLNAADVRPGQSVLVLGLGGVGLSAVRAARLAGASPVIAVDTNATKEQLALRAGADTFAVPDEDHTVRDVVRALTGGDGVDHAIECVGRGSTIRAAWASTRRGGTTTVVGIGSRQDSVTFNPLELFHFARTLQGCVYGSADVARDLRRLFALQSSGRLQAEELVTATIGLADLEQDLGELIGRSLGRTVVDVGGAGTRPA